MKIKLFTIPNVITVLNLFMGSVAVVFALRFDDIQVSFYCIVIAAVLDFFDGFTARLLKQYSPVGKELDSLADVVSFGVAPSAIMFSMFQSMGGVGYWAYTVFVLAMFSALRLAKFNIDERQSDKFIGLNTPACAIFVSSAGYLMAAGIYRVEPWMIILAAAVLSALLVSNIEMFAFKFKHYGLRGNEIRYCFLLAAAISLVVWQITAVPFIIVGYIVVSAISALVCKSQ